MDHSDTMAAIDDLCESFMTEEPRCVAVARGRCEQLALPSISVTPLMGRFLMLLATITRARRVLEIGTLGGYSTAWLAAAIGPAGRVITIEIDPARADAARETFRLGEIANSIEVRCGSGLEEIARIRASGAEPFDLVFIDADKANSAAYFQACIPLTRPGGVIVVDNVIRGGAILDAAGQDPVARGSRAAIEAIGRWPGARATVLQTVSGKGHDGFAIAVVGEGSIGSA